MSDAPSPEERNMVRAALVVMAGFALSNVVGLIRWVLVSRAFGTGAELDAFNAANRLPEFLFNVMAGGALASAFVPTFTEFLIKRKTAQAWRLASSIANMVFVVLTLTAAAAWITAPSWVPLIPYSDPTQIALTIELVRILLISSVVFGLSGLLMGILNAHQHFLLPALAPTSLWIGWILGVLVLVPRMGIHGLAWGAVLGSFLHLAVQVPGLRGRGAMYVPTFGLTDPTVRRVGALMAPRLIGVSVVQLNFIVNVILAAAMPTGSLSAISYGFTIMLMPQVIIAQAIAIAALPTFSAQAARGDRAQLRLTLARTTRSVLYLSLPATVGLILLREPIISLLLERGEFDAQSTRLVAWALLWYAAGLVGHAIVEVVSRAFYALQDTRTPVILGTAAMTINILLSVALAALFSRIGLMPHGGLALANTAATAIESAALLVLMRRRLNGLDFDRVRRGIFTTIGASAGMAMVLWWWLSFTSGSGPWLRGLAGVLLGGGLYWAVTLALKAPEATELPAALIRKPARLVSGDQRTGSTQQELRGQQAEDHSDKGF